MFTSDELAQIEKLYAQGLSEAETANRMEIPLTTFRLKLGRSGWRTRKYAKLERLDRVKPTAQNPSQELTTAA